MSKRGKLLLLSHREGGIGKLEWMLPDMGFEVDLRIPPFGDPYPEKLENYQGLMILGASEGVYDYRHMLWIKEEINWVSKSLDSGIPTLGICFGCQMLASIHGGTVALGQKGISFGYQRISVLEDDPIFGQELEGRMVFDSHNDTFTLPPTALHLASNKHYSQQAAKFREKVYGIQFHPEKDLHEIGLVYESRRQGGRLPPLTPTPEELAAAGQKDDPVVEKWLHDFILRLYS